MPFFLQQIPYYSEATLWQFCTTVKHKGSPWGRDWVQKKVSCEFLGIGKFVLNCRSSGILHNKIVLIRWNSVFLLKMLWGMITQNLFNCWGFLFIMKIQIFIFQSETQNLHKRKWNSTVNFQLNWVVKRLYVWKISKF